MRLLILLMLFSLFYFVSSKSNVKTLTESMGQEVIEIGAPIKELPMGLEEEPSASDDDDDEKASQKVTSNAPLHAAKKESKKMTIPAKVGTNVKDVEKIDGVNQEDEEDRIQKELDEIYKDTADYKSDEEKTSKEQLTSAAEDPTTSEQTNKPIGRQNKKFRFQPDFTDHVSIERFRTSVDEIQCDNRKRLNGLSTPRISKDSTQDNPQSKDAFRTLGNWFILIIAVSSSFLYPFN